MRGDGIFRPPARELFSRKDSRPAGLEEGPNLPPPPLPNAQRRIWRWPSESERAASIPTHQGRSLGSQAEPTRFGVKQRGRQFSYFIIMRALCKSARASLARSPPVWLPSAKLDFQLPLVALPLSLSLSAAGSQPAERKAAGGGGSNCRPRAHRRATLIDARQQVALAQRERERESTKPASRPARDQWS